MAKMKKAHIKEIEDLQNEYKAAVGNPSKIDAVQKKAQALSDKLVKEYGKGATYNPQTGEVIKGE